MGCAVDGCEREATTRGWCTAHYQRWRATGELNADLPIGKRLNGGTCIVEGCERRAQCRGYCDSHYRRLLRQGDVEENTPLGAKPEPRTCAAATCEKPAVERGWCHAHYLRWLRKGDVQETVLLAHRRTPQVCAVEHCERGAHTNGLCQTHHRRLVKHGQVEAGPRFRTADGTGFLHHGYWCVPVPPELRHLTNGETNVREHRLVMAQHLGRPLKETELVHHVNGDRTDNRIENLELWSTYQPRGQRVEDKVAYAVEILRRYQPELLSEAAEAGAD